MSFDWADIVQVFQKIPWWFWPTTAGFAWFGVSWLYKAAIAYIERPIITSECFRQCGVHVDLAEGTITLPRGDTYPLSHVQGLRWEDFSKSGFFHAFIEVSNMKRPIHPVLFSTPDGPEIFIGRLRTAIEKAGGIQFTATASDRFDIIERDFSNPVTAATATRVAGQGLRVSYTRCD